MWDRLPACHAEFTRCGDRLPACHAELDVFHAAGLVPIVLLCRCYVLIGFKFGFLQVVRQPRMGCGKLDRLEAYPTF